MINYIGSSPSTGSRREVYKQGKYPNITQKVQGNEADVRSLGNTYYIAGWDVEFDSGNPFEGTFTLNCETQSDGISPVTGSGQYVTINWSLHYQTTEKELLHCSSQIIPWIGQIVQQDRILLDNLINTPPVGGIVDWTTFSTSSLSVSSSQVVYNMYQSGQRTVSVSTPILRESLTVPSTFDMTGFNSNINTVYTKSTLVSTIGIPSNWAAIMRQDTDPSSTTTAGIPYHYGWQRQEPTNDQNGQTITIQQEYNYGLYPQNIYGSSI